MRAVTNFERMKGPGMVNGPAGVAFYPPQAPKQRTQSIPRIVVVRITGQFVGGGKYTGKILSGKVSGDAVWESSDLAMPESMLLPEEEDCVVINLLEHDDNSHSLTATGSTSKPFRIGLVVGAHYDGRTIVAVDAVGLFDCVV